MVSCNEYLYNTHNHSGLLYAYNWWTWDGIYSIQQSSFFDCPGMKTSAQVYKDYGAHDESGFLGSLWSNAGYTSFDGGHFCLAGWWLDCVNYGCEWHASTNICSTYNDVYVDSVSGSDVWCGISSSYPVKTFAKAYSVLISGGTIHVMNNGADFSAETVTLNKSFSMDLNGASGYFYGPKAS